MRPITKSTTSPAGPARKRACRRTGRVQPLVVVLVIVVLGIAGAAFWYYRSARARRLAQEASEAGVRLSDTTRRALKRLHSPVEIRFYSLLGEESSPDSLRAFSGRVDQLLSGYEREAGGKIKVTSFTSRSEENLDAAASDGLRVFNLDKGEPSYLGLSVAREDQKESLPRIAPEWEQALEADLTRAILRVSGAESLTEQTAATTQAASDATAEVKRAIPNFDSIPVDQARQILRDAAFKELKAAGTEMQTRIQEARQRLSEAQDAGSEDGQKAAVKQLREVQAAQTAKLKEVSARVDAQITALERLKGVSPTDH